MKEERRKEKGRREEGKPNGLPSLGENKLSNGLQVIPIHPMPRGRDLEVAVAAGEEQVTALPSGDLRVEQVLAVRGRGMLGLL